MIAFLIILVLIAALTYGMVRNAKIRSRANRIRTQRASEGENLSRKTSYLAAKSEIQDERRARHTQA